MKKETSKIKLKYELGYFLNLPLHKKKKKNSKTEDRHNDYGVKKWVRGMTNWKFFGKGCSIKIIYFTAHTQNFTHDNKNKLSLLSINAKLGIISH